MNNWQPIETAPRDKTKILVWTGRDFDILWWSERLNGWTFNDDWEVDDPTHWQPLPAPPESPAP
jgi:hypothetical protein